MKLIYINRLLYSLAATAFLFLGACSEMNDLHDPYLRRGETIYVGKPDSVKIFAGNERALIRYWASDPKAAKLVVYWLSRTDSMVFDIPSHHPAEALEVMLTNLPEYNYTFELETLNEDYKYRSVTLEASGNTYGSFFQNSLRNRLVSSTEFSDSQLQIEWLGAIENAIATEIVYMDTLGATSTVFAPMSEAVTVIDDVDNSVEYRTLFLPEENAIDTFYTEFIQIPL